MMAVRSDGYGRLRGRLGGSYHAAMLAYRVESFDVCFDNGDDGGREG